MSKLFYLVSFVFIFGNTACFSQEIGDALKAKDTIKKEGYIKFFIFK